jgi:hypothetical protein
MKVYLRYVIALSESERCYNSVVDLLHLLQSLRIGNEAQYTRMANYMSPYRFDKLRKKCKNYDPT